MASRKKSSLRIVTKRLTQEKHWQLIVSDTLQLIGHEDDESLFEPRG